MEGKERLAAAGGRAAGPAGRQAAHAEEVGAGGDDGHAERRPAELAGRAVAGRPLHMRQRVLRVEHDERMNQSGISC
eukprot:scaffold147463_cov43-Prasinocladus_malaysianus.AAC.1